MRIPSACKFLPLLVPFTLAAALAKIPDHLVVQGVPDQPPTLQGDVSRYLEFRTAAFRSWHPQRWETLVSTRFGQTAQLHLVKQPGGGSYGGYLTLAALTHYSNRLKCICGSFLFPG